MIILKCDICKKQVDDVESIVLYSNKIDYCKKCRNQAMKKMAIMKESMKYFYDIADQNIREAEKNIIRKRRY